MTDGSAMASMKPRERMEASLARRYRSERRFKTVGLISVFLGLSFLVVFFASIVRQGYPAFTQSFVALDIEFDPAVLASGDYQKLIRDSLYEMFPDVVQRKDRRELSQLVSIGASYQLQDSMSANPADRSAGMERIWFPAGADADLLIKARDGRVAENTGPEAWIDHLVAEGRVDQRFNRALFTNGDSREPELAGIRGALMGSAYMLLVTIALSFPIGVAAAVYLEEFAPRNRWTDLVEVNINNLAAVPSIVFGLLGLAVFINWFSLPRSAPLVGGLVLSLLTLPVIIIAARASIKSVPPSIREAALGLGASKVQTVFQHVVPLALPGILTGTIIGMARALGETAPLLMIGMVAFIVDPPKSALDPASALPVQIFLWADSPERAFTAKTSAAIMILLGFLLLMNLLAVLLRRRYERSW